MEMSIAENYKRPDGLPEVGHSYRGSAEMVAGLSRNFEIPDSFFDAKGGNAHRDLQDPQTWLDALQIKDDAKRLNASLDFKNGSYMFNFTTDGKFPENLVRNSKSGMLAELVIGEAKLKAVHDAMPEAYALGRGRVEKSIKETQQLRRNFAATLNDSGIKDLKGLLSKDRKWRPGITPKGAMMLSTMALTLYACTGIPVIPSHPITKEPSNTPSVTVSPTDEGPTGTATVTKEPSATPEKTYPITRDPENEAGMCRINLVKDENGALRVPESLLRFEQKNALPLIATEEELELLDYSARQLKSTDAFVLDLNPTGIDNKHIVRLFNICKTSLVPFGGEGLAYVWVYQYTNKDGTPAFLHLLISGEDHQKQIDSGRIYGSGADAFLFPVAKAPDSSWASQEDYAAIKEEFWKKQFNTVTAKEGQNAAIEVAKQAGGSDTFDEVAQQLIWISGFATY